VVVVVGGSGALCVAGPQVGEHAGGRHVLFCALFCSEWELLSDTSLSEATGQTTCT
jgi:hypothetical protein